MIIIDFIDALKKKEISISFSGGKLKYSGPEENITPELIESLKKYKGKLIKYFWPKELSNLMPINPEGNQVPLFIVHGDNSNYIISEYLGPDQPVYGFFHPGSEGERILYRNIKQMARSYIEKIQMISPSGPYYLIGYSFGGNLAFEMAIQMQKEGYKVPFLVLIDSICPITKARIRWEKGFFRIIRKNFLKPAKSWIKSVIIFFICELYIWRNIPVPYDKRQLYIRMKYSTFLRSYAPEKYNGEILLFRATENTFSYRTLGWEKLATSVNIIELKGKHLDIFAGKGKSEILQIEIKKYLAYVNGLK